MADGATEGDGVSVVTTTSADETRRLASRLAEAAAAGDVIALRGELGAGKTQFAKGFAAGLGVTTVVNSPSFTLMAEYAGRIPLFHLDLYRLAGAGDALAGGLIDERQREGVSLIEWAERLDGPIGASDLEVRFGGAGEEPRDIALIPRSAAGRRYVEALTAWTDAEIDGSLRRQPVRWRAPAAPGAGGAGGGRGR